MIHDEVKKFFINQRMINIKLNIFILFKKNFLFKFLKFLKNKTNGSKKNVSLSSNLKNAFGNEIIKSKKISTNDGLLNALLSQY